MKQNTCCRIKGHGNIIKAKLYSMNTTCIAGCGGCSRDWRSSYGSIYKKHMKLYQKQYAHGEKTLEEITRSVRSYHGHLKHGDTWKLRKHLYSNLIFTRGNSEMEERE